MDSADLDFKRYNDGMDNTMNNSPSPATSKKPSRHLLWPILLTSLISIHIISVIVMVVVATHDRSFALEPDWYAKGLHYEQTVQQHRENSRLNWSIKLDIGQPLAGTKQREVACTLSDGGGKAIQNAKIDLVAFAHLRANDRTSSVLLPQEDGRYLAIMDFEEIGMWEFRFAVTRGPDTFTHIVKRAL